jgi:hypothetical protein
LLPVLYLHLVVSKIPSGCAIRNLNSTVPVATCQSRHYIFEKVAIIPSYTGSQPKNRFLGKKLILRRSEETKYAKYYIVFLTVVNWLNIRLRVTDLVG